MKKLAVIACIFLSSQSFASGQTFDLNVTCPVQDDSRIHHSSEHHHSHHGHSNHKGCKHGVGSKCEQMILQQNQMLKIQFGQAQKERHKILIELARQQAETDASVEDLKRTMSKKMAANHSSIKEFAKRSANQDEKIMFEIRSFAKEFEELSEKLVAANLQSVKNSNAMIELIKQSNAKIGQYQKQISGNLRSIQKGLKNTNAVFEQMVENQQETESLFAALDEDMEDIRSKMLLLQKAQQNSQKQLGGKLNLLKDIAKHLKEKSDKEMSDKKKSEKAKNKKKQASNKKQSSKKKPEPKQKKKKK